MLAGIDERCVEIRQNLFRAADSIWPDRRQRIRHAQDRERHYFPLARKQ
jgi:hypothetical protein